jgi:hypothetical protein
LRVWWHRHDVAWLLDELGLGNLDEFDAFLAKPLTAAEERFLATRARILARLPTEGCRAAALVSLPPRLGVECPRC